MVLKLHQWNRTRRLLGFLLLALAALFSSTQVHAQRLLVEVSGLTDVVLDQFVADARAQAPGLEIVVFHNAKAPGAALGDVRSGAIGLAVLPLSTLGIRAADAMVPPWTYQDPREVAKAISSEAAEVTSAELEKTGVYALQYWQSSFSYFASTKEINPFSVVKDKRVLVQQDTQGSRVIAALGGKLTPSVFAETYEALRVGTTIDAAVVPAESFARGRLYEVLRHVADDPYQPVIAVLLVNRAVWSSLSFEAQTALASAAKAFARSARDRVSAQQARFKSFAQSRGVQLTSLTQASIFEAQQAAFRVWADAVPDTPHLRDLYTVNLQSARAPFLDAGLTAFPESQETVHFITSRVRENSTKPQLAFGAKGELNHLNYGSAHVTLKAGRKLDSDLDDFAIIDAVAHHPDLNGLQSAIGQASELFVFIHGYRTTFPQAVARAAAAKRDLGLSGPVLVFSWPSEGALLAYGADESSSTLHASISKLLLFNSNALSIWTRRQLLPTAWAADW